jgi:hypothetical protein
MQEVKTGVSEDYWKYKKSDLKKNSFLGNEPELSFPIECTNCETCVGSYLFGKKKYI